MIPPADVVGGLGCSRSPEHVCGTVGVFGGRGSFATSFFCHFTLDGLVPRTLFPLFSGGTIGGAFCEPLREDGGRLVSSLTSAGLVERTDCREVVRSFFPLLRFEEEGRGGATSTSSPGEVGAEPAGGGAGAASLDGSLRRWMASAGLAGFVFFEPLLLLFVLATTVVSLVCCLASFECLSGGVVWFFGGLPPLRPRLPPATLVGSVAALFSSKAPEDEPEPPAPTDLFSRLSPFEDAAAAAQSPAPQSAPAAVPQSETPQSEEVFHHSPPAPQSPPQSPLFSLGGARSARSARFRFPPPLDDAVREELVRSTRPV